jgi:hypothetical protein
LPKQRTSAAWASCSANARSIGRSVIAAIGIDRYHHWRQLSNAVRDATGTVELFRRLGFEQVNRAATR